MAETKTSRVQQIFEPLKSFAEENNKRFQNLYGNLSELEEKGLAQLSTYADEANRLTHSTVNYYKELSTAWRDLGLEISKRVTSWQPGV